MLLVQFPKSILSKDFAQGMHRFSQKIAGLRGSKACLTRGAYERCLWKLVEAYGRTSDKPLIMKRIHGRRGRKWFSGTFFER